MGSRASQPNQGSGHPPFHPTLSMGQALNRGYPESKDEETRRGSRGSGMGPAVTRALWVYSRCLSHAPGPCIREGPPGRFKEPDQVGVHTGRLTPPLGPWHSLTTPHHGRTSPGRQPGRGPGGETSPTSPLVPWAPCCPELLGHRSVWRARTQLGSGPC